MALAHQHQHVALDVLGIEFSRAAAEVEGHAGEHFDISLAGARGQAAHEHGVDELLAQRSDRCRHERLLGWPGNDPQRQGLRAKRTDAIPRAQSKTRWPPDAGSHRVSGLVQRVIGRSSL
jgi:hypothetical protein